ncbi:ATP-binding cassette domain-containing protein [Streptomyces sp. NPDC032472]|uniref:ATP-binding cassette domain-containing protein n=1 Tax=Streptomyces sp. NPDC032472 TaxID=3155018 RepID=UPI0033DFC3BA
MTRGFTYCSDPTVPAKRRPSGFSPGSSPTQGTVLVNGKNPHRQADAKSAIGLAGHRSALAHRLSVVDNLRYWARVLGLASGPSEARIADVLALLGLEGLADERVGSLSRGQNQRVGLAKAFLGRPPILLLDEPMSGLDPTMAEQLSDHLKGLADHGPHHRHLHACPDRGASAGRRRHSPARRPDRRSRRAGGASGSPAGQLLSPADTRHG